MEWYFYKISVAIISWKQDWLLLKWRCCAGCNNLAVVAMVSFVFPSSKFAKYNRCTVRYFGSWSKTTNLFLMISLEKFTNVAVSVAISLLRCWAWCMKVVWMTWVRIAKIVLQALGDSVICTRKKCAGGSSHFCRVIGHVIFGRRFGLFAASFLPEASSLVSRERFWPFVS